VPASPLASRRTAATAAATSARTADGPWQQLRTGAGQRDRRVVRENSVAPTSRSSLRIMSLSVADPGAALPRGAAEVQFACDGDEGSS
jgi:hypothetical protein